MESFLAVGLNLLQWFISWTRSSCLMLKQRCCQVWRRSVPTCLVPVLVLPWEWVLSVLMEPHSLLSQTRLPQVLRALSVCWLNFISNHILAFNLKMCILRLGHTNLISCFSSPPAHRFLETDKNTNTICTEREHNETQKQTFVQRNCNGTQTQINSIERKWVGTSL